MSQVEGKRALLVCLYFSFPINAPAVSPWKSPKPHPLEYNRNTKQYLLAARNWQLTQSPLVTQQSLTRLYVCVWGSRGGVRCENAEAM